MECNEHITSKLYMDTPKTGANSKTVVRQCVLQCVHCLTAWWSSSQLDWLHFSLNWQTECFCSSFFCYCHELFWIMSRSFLCPNFNHFGNVGWRTFVAHLYISLLIPIWLPDTYSRWVVCILWYGPYIFCLKVFHPCLVEVVGDW